MFRSVTIIRKLVLNLAKVTNVKSSVKIHRYKLCIINNNNNNNNIMMYFYRTFKICNFS